MDYGFLVKTAIFKGITEKEAESVLKCLQGTVRSFGKNEAVFRSGERTDRFGIILSGSVAIEIVDVWGNSSVLDKAGPGMIFAEAYACVPEEPLMVDVTATEDSEILFLKATGILSACSNACSFHSRLGYNLLYVTAQKNLSLSRKNFHMSPKTIRGKLLSYLSYQAFRQGRREFEIPFDRQQLADYLGVDRSAMSGELSKLRREGLLTCRKNKFSLSDTV